MTGSDFSPRAISTAGRIDVAPLPPSAGEEPAVVERVTTLINEVYAASERALWLPGTTRTSRDEIAESTRAGQIAVARPAGRIVGCVQVRRHDADTGEFGMLATDPAHRGAGIGRELVRFAERSCRADGLRFMRLAVLVPRHRPHPDKQFLIAWYTRMGYRSAHSETLDEVHPELASLLAEPADIAIYRKVLAD